MRCLIFYVSFICLVLHQTGFAQFDNYTEQWPVFLSSQTALFGNGLSVYDFDQDGLDDITVAELNQGIALFRNNGNGFELFAYHIFQGDVKQITWVDYDNDHDPDLFFTANGQGIHLLNNDGSLNFTDQSFLFEEYAESFAYGAAWADYDRNGLLDVYVCMYDYPGTSVFPNLMFHQNDDHTFSEVGSALGVSSATDEAFQPVWIDFDHDGWMDLYVINDHSVPNEFYHNNAGESFSEIAQMNGSNVAQSSMSNSVSDYDNDGDFDIFITDGGAPVLLQNNNGMFTDVAATAGVGQWANNWSALWIDFDLDGFEDVHVCTENPGNQPDNNFFYYNQQNGEFYDSGLDDTNRDSFCAAKGDFNNDGRWDYVVLNGYPPSLNIWVSNGNQSSVKIDLQGTVSNAGGVGAFVEYWVNGNRRITQTQCGENYISQNAHAEIFATEGSSFIDSLNIFWPSGWADHYENLQADSSYTMIEGETIEAQNELFEVLICPGDSVLLAVNADGDLIWENGDTATQRWVFAPGDYVASFTNEFGFVYTHSFQVSNLELPEVTPLVFNPSCADSNNGQIILVADESMFISANWNDGVEGMTHSNLPAGEVSCSLVTVEGCAVELQFLLTSPLPMGLQHDLDTTVCFNAAISVAPVVTGGSAPYAISWPDQNPESLGEGQHLFEVTDANGCVDSFSFVITWLPEIVITLDADTACPGATTVLEYAATGGSGNLSFDFGDLDPLNAAAGIYEVTVTDELFCADTQTVEVSEWDEMINTVVITPAQNGPNGAAQIITAGGSPPYTYLWNNEMSEPTLSNLPQGEYACVVTDSHGCTQEVLVSVIDVSVEEYLNQLQVYPNPFSDHLNLVSTVPLDFMLMDESGKVVLHGRSHLFPAVDTTALRPGVYLLQLMNGTFYKLIKME